MYTVMVNGMPKLSWRCRKCGRAARRPTYYREAIPNTKNCRWIRIPWMFYCEDCKAITIDPFTDREVKEIYIVKGHFPFEIHEVE